MGRTRPPYTPKTNGKVERFIQTFTAYSDESGQSFRFIPVSFRSKATRRDPQFRVTGLVGC